jgi:hypothetical protein
MSEAAITRERVPSDRDGLIAVEHLGYRGKRYEIPCFDTAGGLVLKAHPEDAPPLPSADESPVVRCIHGLWDLTEFERPRRPVSLGTLTQAEIEDFTRPDAVRVLDMPIKLPDCDEYRLPRALAQFAGAIQRIIDVEHTLNPHHADYHAYLTIDQRWVAPHTLHREAPCHVDGFQGARWHPRCHNNHSYTVSDVLPTAYYVQPFHLRHLDERLHDFFWEMNAQVADTDESFRWQPAEAEITLMDCYCVHRGVENTSPTPVFRTWLRLSFEERRRVFDRLGNAHNPLFDYDWPMVERDIEQLHLRAYREDGDPSLRVFPWQDLSGNPLPRGAPKTKPRLRRRAPSATTPDADKA